MPELERARAAKQKSLDDAKTDSMNRLMKDLAIDRQKNPRAFSNDRWEEDEGGDEEDEDEDDDINIIDRCEWRRTFDYRSLTFA